MYLVLAPISSSDISNSSCSLNDKGQCLTKDAVILKISDDDVNKAEIPKGANQEGKPREAVKECIDRYPKECQEFVRAGECLKTPGWMIMNCAKSCDKHNNACRLRDPKLRCSRESLGIETTPVYQPGDMNKMFQSLIPRYSGQYNINVLSESPWVVVFDNFLNDKEINALIDTVDKWERSTDTGVANEYGETGRILSSGRTSSNSWCRGACEDHPDVKSVMRKIEEVTYVPYRNYESFQVLRYEQGQKYTVHHDYGIEDIKLPCGPRILTFFLYLSDVEEGGHTAFPSLNISVQPRRGSALLWPSTLDSNPELQDIRTMHEAKPVIKGSKYAANSWIHLYEYAKPNVWGCTGVFDEL